jgi:hypothetical protein
MTALWHRISAAGLLFVAANSCTDSGIVGSQLCDAGCAADASCERCDACDASAQCAPDAAEGGDDVEQNDENDGDHESGGAMEP